jgi:ABC-type uncharacterized transport system permease subunit
MRFLEIILAALYLSSAVVYTMDFVRSNRRLESACSILIRITLGWHILYMIILSAAFKRIPVANFQEFLSALALGLVIIYLYLELRFRTRSLGPWILGLAAIIQVALAILVEHPAAGDIHRIFTSVWFPFHILFGILANASILITAVFSLMYLILYRSLKRKMFDHFFERFLPLATLGEMNYQALLTGVISFTLMIPFGFAMVFSLHGEIVWDFKYCMFFTSYLVYLAGALLGMFARWRGNRLAIFSLFGICVLVVTISAAMLYSERHLWY